MDKWLLKGEMKRRSWSRADEKGYSTRTPNVRRTYSTARGWVGHGDGKVCAVRRGTAGTGGPGPGLGHGAAFAPAG